MILEDDARLREACARCLEDPADAGAYDRLMNGARIVGRGFLRLYSIMPPTMRRMACAPYAGAGIISFDRTIASFGRGGKSLEGVIARYRREDVKKLNLALLYDDSNSMTAWWRNKNTGIAVGEPQAPQAYAKVACLALMEGLGKAADISLWTFGSQAEGPFNASTAMYRQLISRNGSGGTRLDLALQSLVDRGWHRRRGENLVIVLTDGVPEVGRSVYSEDLLVNVKALELMRGLQLGGARVLYVQLHTDDSRRYKKSGGYTMEEFGAAIERAGGLVMDVGTANRISDTLFKGLQKALRRR